MVTQLEKYGPINSIVLSRSGDSDNVYLRDEQSVEQNGLCEIKISDNQLMNFNDRSDYLQGILNALNGLYYYINDFNSTGILYYEIGDLYNVNIRGKTYQCLMLNDEVNINSGTEEIIYTDMPQKNETDYTKADKTDRRINQTYIIVDKQNQTIESVVTNVSEQNNKISRVEQKVDEIISSISDIADITTSQETLTGRLIFDSVNQSEPIHIEIHPTGESISFLYPFENLYPANNLYIRLRTLRFKNTTTNEVFDYELPNDLLYYDSNNYDSFELDYDSQTVYVNKKCKYNSTTGAVELLPTEQIINYPFPSIELTSGNYTIEMLKYDNTLYPCFLFVRLMAQNIYTTQFATHAEVNSKITQTATNINLSVDQKLTNYSTTSQMNSAIDIKVNEITSTVSSIYETKANAANIYATKQLLNSSIEQTAQSITQTVSETYETKVNANNKYETKANASNTYATKTSLSTAIKQTAKSIELTATDNTTSAKLTIRLKNEDGTALDTKTANITMSGLVKFTDLKNSGSTEINGANITTGKISASRLELTDYLTVSSASNTYATKTGLSNGTTTINGGCITTGSISANRINGGSLNLTGGNTTITSTNFSVTKDGNITAKGGKIGGWNISDTALSKTTGNYNFEIRTDRASNSEAFLVWDNLNGRYNFYVRPDGFLYARNAEINGKITATSGVIGGCTISNGSLVVKNANIENINPGKITSGTISTSNFILETSSGYLKCGSGINHPYLSAINIAYGGGGISFRNGTSVGNVGSEIGKIYSDTSSGSNVMYLSSAGGINLCNGTARIIPNQGVKTNNVFSDTCLVDLDRNLDLWSGQGYHVRANGTRVGGDNSTLNIKENVKERNTSSVLDILKEIKLYDYNYIPEFYNGEKSYGYIIDYLQQIPGLDNYLKFVDINDNEKYPTKVVESQEQWIKFLLACVIELNKCYKGEII